MSCGRKNGIPAPQAGRERGRRSAVRLSRWLDLQALYSVASRQIPPLVVFPLPKTFNKGLAALFRQPPVLEEETAGKVPGITRFLALSAR